MPRKNFYLQPGGLASAKQLLNIGRDAAIKVLPEQFAKDADRVPRFQREAKLLASLNHPGIAAIHGLEEFGKTSFLVLELVEGDTLAEQIKKGPIPVEECLKPALQIAEALESAGACKIKDGARRPRLGSLQRQTAHFRKKVETAVECGNPGHVVVEHHSRMNGITNSDPFSCAHELFCPIGVRQSCRKNYRTQLHEQFINLSRQIGPLEGDVAIENLLQDFSACAGLYFARTDPFHKSTCGLAQRMVAAGDIHGYVGIDEYSHARPASISASI
jgi:ribosomal protein L32